MSFSRAITLTDMRYLVALEQERHFGHAAESCHVSQPTLSVAIRKLEDLLDAQLFERRRTQVLPTPMCLRLVEQAKKVLHETAVIDDIVQSHADQLHGPLRLGAIYTIGPYLLPNLLPVINERAPHMPLLIKEDYTANLAVQLRNGELDAIIISLPFEQEGIVTQALYDEPFIVLIPASHPWNQKDRVNADELSYEPVMLLGEGHCFRDQVLDVCPGCLHSNALGTDLQQTLEGSSLETIRYMVESGAGITVLPCTAAMSAKHLVKVRRFKNANPSRRVALAWRSSFPRPKAIQALHEAITSCPLTCVQMIDAPAEVENVTALKKAV